jgi:hypothetical protein
VGSGDLRSVVTPAGVTRIAGPKPGKETTLNTGTTIAAAMIVAEARALSSGEAQTVVALPAKRGPVIEVTASSEVIVLREQGRLDGRQSLISVLPDGTVEIHQRITLPPEAIPCV